MLRESGDCSINVIVKSSSAIPDPPTCCCVSGALPLDGVEVPIYLTLIPLIEVKKVEIVTLLFYAPEILTVSVS